MTTPVFRAPDNATYAEILVQINYQELGWAGRMMLIILLAGVADTLVVALARNPFPWVLIIPALVPLLSCVFVIIPKIKAGKHLRR